MTYKNIISALNDITPFHDDMIGERVVVLVFPYSDYFGDFRMFNGIRLREMDELLTNLRQVCIDIRNESEVMQREKQLREEKAQ